eukprot:s4365_g4.t1
MTLTWVDMFRWQLGSAPSAFASSFALSMSTTSFEVVEVESNDGASEVGISKGRSFHKVLQKSDVQEVQQFIRKLQDGVDPFKTELADSLQKLGRQFSQGCVVWSRLRGRR